MENHKALVCAVQTMCRLINPSNGVKFYNIGQIHVHDVQAGFSHLLTLRNGA